MKQRCKTIRHISPILIALASAMLAAGCGPTADSSGLPPLVVSVEQQSAWVRNFNPFLTLGDTRWPSSGGIYEPLMIHNVVTAAFVPWLATGYEWDETDHVLGFALRPGVHWSDGAPLTVDDVVFTFELKREHPELDTNAVWDFLREVKAVDDTRVEFVFQHTFVPGFRDLATQVIVPQHIWQDVADPVTFANENPVGTGPFTEVLRFDEHVYELGANPNYWRGRPPVPALRMPSFSSNEEVIEALLAGEVDWSGNFIPEVEESFVAKDPEHRGFWSPLIAGPVYLYANTTRAPFDEVPVRKALSMAIDRERLAEGPMQGYTRPADGTGLGDAHRQVRSPEAVAAGSWSQFDPKAAERALDEAGYARGANGFRGPAGGEPWSYDLLVPEGWTDWVGVTQIIAEQLTSIGVQVTSTQIPQSRWIRRAQTGDFDLAIGWSQEGPSPYTYYRRLMGTPTVRPIGERAGLNWHRFGDAGADVLLEAVELTREEPVRRVLFLQLQLKFAELAPAVPLFLGPSWGTFNSTRYVGFPSEDNPYAVLSPNHPPETLLVLTKLRPRSP